MSDDDLRYKEYKAQVPLKWSSFDQNGLPRSKRRFIEFLRSSSSSAGQPGGIVEDGGWHDPDDAMDVPRAGDAAGRRGSAVDVGSTATKKRPWIEEMTAYCKEVEMRAIAKAKSQQLEAELRKRQERANLQRERALEAAATSLSTVNGRQEGKAPNDVVCAAMELETQYLVRRYENRFAAKVAKREDTLEKHLKVASERQKAVEQSLHERSMQLHDDIERREASAHKEALRQQEAKRRHLEDEIRKAEQRSKELEERLRQSREARNRQLAEQREETERHIRHALELREERQRVYEEQLEEQLALINQRLQERKRQQEVLIAEDKVGKALARAQAERAEQRAKQLAACEQAEQHRLAALKEKRAADAELQLSIAQKNHDRERRADSNIERLANQSLKRGQQVAARSHAATPSTVQRTSLLSSPGADESLVAKDLALHLERREQHVQQLVNESLQSEADEFARHERWLQRQREVETLARAREQSREEKRRIARARAMEAQQLKAATVEKEARQRQEKSEKVLQALRQEAQEGMHSANEEQARKARAAIELVQVKQRSDLLRATIEKEKRIEANAAERDAIRRVQLQEHQEAQERRWSETMAHIQHVTEAREEHLQESLANKEERRRKAMLQREDAKHDLQKKLQAQDEARAASLRADEAARETRFLKSVERIANEDAQWSAARDRQRRNENEYRAAMADEHTRRIEKAQQLREKQRAEKMERTIATLKANYGRQTPHLGTHYDFHPPLIRPHSSQR